MAKGATNTESYQVWIVISEWWATPFIKTSILYGFLKFLKFLADHISCIWAILVIIDTTQFDIWETIIHFQN